MNRRSISFVVVLLAGLYCSVPVRGDEDAAKAVPPASKPSRLTSDSRVQLIRGLQSEHAFVKVPFPMGKKGLTLKKGRVAPEPMKLQQMIASEGAAAKVGERVEITSFAIDGKSLVFEINGGPRKGPKWYNRISIMGAGGETPLKQMDPARANAKGSVLTLQFDSDVPNLTVDEVKKLLAPVFDFTPMSQAEAYQSTLPKIVQDAIKNHHVLVGMDREMVVYAVGRPEKKYRDKDETGADYEEWIYGTPPAEVQFVRFVGNEVARLEIMRVDGEKIVKTEREFQLATKRTEEQAQAAQNTGPRKRPTLLDPGEQTEGKTAPVAKGNGSAPPPSTGSPSPEAPGNPAPAKPATDEPITPAPR